MHDYIHVADVARANVMAMASDVTGEVFNVVTGVETTVRRIAEILLDVTGSDLTPDQIPFPVIFRDLRRAFLRADFRSKIDYELDRGFACFGEILGVDNRSDTNVDFQEIIEGYGFGHKKIPAFAGKTIW